MRDGMINDGANALARFEVVIGRDLLNPDRRCSLVVRETYSASAVPLVDAILQYVERQSWSLALVSYQSRSLALVSGHGTRPEVHLDLRRRLGEPRHVLGQGDLAKLIEHLRAQTRETVLLIDNLTALANDCGRTQLLEFMALVRQSAPKVHFLGIYPAHLAGPEPLDAMSPSFSYLISSIKPTIVVSLHTLDYLAIIADYESSNLQAMSRIQQDVTTPIGGRHVQAHQNKRLKFLSYSILDHHFTFPHLVMECTSNTKSHKIDRWRLVPLDPGQSVAKRYTSEVISLLEGHHEDRLAKEEVPDEVKLEVPFNLTLSETQKAARAQVQLPYLHTNNDVEILYEPDSGDDFDDEEGIDDDLDI